MSSIYPTAWLSNAVLTEIVLGPPKNTSKYRAVGRSENPGVPVVNRWA